MLQDQLGDKEIPITLCLEYSIWQVFLKDYLPSLSQYITS